MNITKQMYHPLCKYYCAAIIQHQNQVAVDVIAKRPAAVAMMQRNDAASADSSWSNIALFISAAALYFDSLTWTDFRC